MFLKILKNDRITFLLCTSEKLIPVCPLTFKVALGFPLLWLFIYSCLTFPTPLPSPLLAWKQAYYVIFHLVSSGIFKEVFPSSLHVGDEENFPHRGKLGRYCAMSP